MERDTLRSRLKHAWNAFSNRDPTRYYGSGPSYYYRPDRPHFTRGNERSIVTSVYNRVALDSASVDIRHVKLDEDGRYKEDVNSCLNSCLTLEANIDETARNFRHNAVVSMFDEGYVALVPIDTIGDPIMSSSYDIQTMRVGKIVEWFPRYVRVNVYNDRTGKFRDLTLPKEVVAIIENPFRAVINEPNSTLQRLIRKLNLLDAVDEQSSSGKLDIIIQLPYTIKTDARKEQAEKRRNDIEKQLSGSKYGIAYADAAEHITQLNRPVENNLMNQVKYLTELLFSQLGITQGILDGTADEKTMVNYTNRTIEPILSAITDEMKRKFLTKTARTKGQSIMFFNDPFKLVPLTNLAELSDKLTRNEIMSPNEIRQKIGMKPSSDPAADELRNRNINQSNEDNKIIKNKEENQNDES